MTPLADLASRARGWWRARFEGDVSPWCYTLFRIAVATLVLVRSADWLRGVMSLYHHSWVQGLEYDPRIESVTPPALRSPLIPGLSLGDGLARALVIARTVLAGLLLVGLRPRLCAAALALVGAALVASDRYRYFHHVYLMWLSVGWLALAPSGERLSVEGLWRRGRGPRPDLVPRWPLQLLRLQTVAIYAAAGIAKLNADWLGGKTLSELSQLGLVGGRLWTAAASRLGYAGLGIGICAAELGAAAMLLVPGRIRWAGIAVAVALHAGVATAMSVSTFGAQMAALLLLFLPWRERRP